MGSTETSSEALQMEGTPKGIHHSDRDTSSSQPSSRLYPLLRSLCFLVAILMLSNVSPIHAAPSRCMQAPPPQNCAGSVFMGNAYYYNASARVPCLRMPNWGCEGQNKFSSAEECMSVCGEPEEPSPDEVCNRPVKNFFCPQARVTLLWVYNPGLELCHPINFFNCLPVQPNMFQNEADCINMCASTPNSSPSPSPLSSHVTALHSSPSTSSSSLDHVTSTVATAAPTNIPTTTETIPTTNGDTTSPTETTPTSASETTPTTSRETTSTEVPTETEPTVDETLSVSHRSQLTTFDMASICVSAVVFLLIVILVIVIISLVHRRRVLLKRHPPRSASASVVEFLQSADSCCPEDSVHKQRD